MAHRPIITLTTDFGLNDHFVGTIKGVILSISPEIEIVDISHSVQAFDVLDGALTIALQFHGEIAAIRFRNRSHPQLEAGAS